MHHDRHSGSSNTNANTNASISKPERATQDRVIRLFTQQLGYRFLGDWSQRPGNHCIEEELLAAHLRRRGYGHCRIARHRLEQHSRQLDPAKNPADRAVQSQTFEYQPRPGETLVFRTRPGASASFDWAFWQRIAVE